MANNGIQLKCSYTGAPNWFRGNLHTHTTRSDGSRPPEQVIADYEARGYDFLVISDHDVLVELDGYQKDTSMTLIHGVFTEPVNGWRKTSVRQRRTAGDWAEEIHALLNEDSPA